MPLTPACSTPLQEETGYVVDAKDVRFINSHISSSGTAGARHYMFYAEVWMKGLIKGEHNVTCSRGVWF